MTYRDKDLHEAHEVGDLDPLGSPSGQKRSLTCQISEEMAQEGAAAADSTYRSAPSCSRGIRVWLRFVGPQLQTKEDQRRHKEED